MAKAFSSAAGRAIRTAQGKAQSHTSMIRAVRAAARRLDLDDDDRRAIQLDLTGKQSMSAMTLAELGKLLDHFNKGWKGPMGHRAPHAKIKALWWTLYWLGAVDRPDALDAFVKRQTGISALRFLDHGRSASVIEALKAWAVREGVRWPDDAQLAELNAHNAGLTMAQLERHRVLEAIGDRLRDRGAMHAIYIGYVQKALLLGHNHWAWSTHELDAGIKLLGKMLRRLVERERDAG